MKHPKNQRELFTLLVEQDKQLQHQDQQIKVLKLALLRMEQQMRSISKVAERAHDNTRMLNERVRRTEAKLLQS